MFVLQLQSKIPHDTFSRHLSAHRISSSLIEQLKHALKDLDDAEKKFLTIVKSPAFFAINNTFSLIEYLKNAADAKASKIHFYISVEQAQINCIIFDNGQGINDGCLFNEIQKKQQLIDYYETQLMSQNNEEKQHIQSNKRAIQKALGGEGLGLAIISRILKTGKGCLKIGNVQQLSQDNIEKIKKYFNIPENGAAIVLNAPLYSSSLAAEYQKNQSKLIQDNNQRYLNYCWVIDMELNRTKNLYSPISATYTTSSSSSNDNNELSLSRRASPLSLNLESLKFDDNEEECIDSPSNSSQLKKDAEDDEMESKGPCTKP